VLLDVARESIRHRALGRGELPIDPGEFAEPLRELRATFVTLELDGALRGCIGSLLASRPLVVDVARNAARAASIDPRFAPVTVQEVDDLDIHISILSPLEEIECDGDRDVLASIEPGVHGLVLVESFTAGTLLPAVWERVPDASEFVAAVKAKAGLPSDYWSDTVQFYRYTVETVP